MILKAEKSGTFPAGCHWEVGEVRQLDLEKDAAIPSWLVEVKVKAKAKSKKAEPKTDEA